MITVILPVKKVPLSNPVLSMYIDGVLIGSIRYNMQHPNREGYNNRKKRELMKKYWFLKNVPGKLEFCIEGVISKASFVKVDTETITA